MNYPIEVDNLYREIMAAENQPGFSERYDEFTRLLKETGERIAGLYRQAGWKGDIRPVNWEEYRKYRGLFAL